MNELDLIKYCKKIIQFRDDYIEKTKRFNMQSENSLCMFLDPVKTGDKKLVQIVKEFIKIGIFKKENGYFYLDQESKFLAREKIEQMDCFRELDSLYDIVQNKSKGTLF